MFEPIGKYEGNNSPMDAKEDGREEWVAGRLIDARAEEKTVEDALEWHADNYGTDMISFVLSHWMSVEHCTGSLFMSKRLRASEMLRAQIEEIVSGYCDQVLWPEYVQKVKNGNFEG